jgi:Ca-activated chloride channel family protein
VTFAHPAFLAGLLLVPLAIFALIARRRRRKRYAVRFTGVGTLKMAAAGGVPAWRSYVPAALALASLAALVFALAKPQRTVAVPTGKGNVMLVTDHSLSMQATDVQPSRLAAAKSAAHAFVGRLPKSIGVGIVAYSNAPDAVRPPDTDHSQALQVIDAEEADGATATGDALQVALDALAPAGSKTKRLPSSILLLSDGRTTTGRDPVEVARIAKSLKIPIYTVSVGTEDALIPNPGFGPPLPVPPDPDTLRRIAQASGGRAYAAEDENQLSSIYKNLGSQLGTKKVKREATNAFAIGAVALLLAAAAGSLRWSGRLP